MNRGMSAAKHAQRNLIMTVSNPSLSFAAFSFPSGAKCHSKKGIINLAHIAVVSSSLPHPILKQAWSIFGQNAKDVRGSDPRNVCSQTRLEKPAYRDSVHKLVCPNLT